MTKASYSFEELSNAFSILLLSSGSIGVDGLERRSLTLSSASLPSVRCKRKCGSGQSLRCSSTADTSFRVKG